jgi:hypothetical protein
MAQDTWAEWAGFSITKGGHREAHAILCPRRIRVNKQNARGFSKVLFW